MIWECKYIILASKSLLIGIVTSLSAVAYRAVLHKADALRQEIFAFASSPLRILLLEMVGIFSGIVRAPVTGIILVTEMSGSLTQFTGLVLVSAVAALTANLLGSKPIYDELLKNMLHNRSSSH